MFGLFPLEVLDKYPDFHDGIESIDKENALELCKDLEERGFVHNIWTYRVPYLGKLCHCNTRDCIGFMMENISRSKIITNQSMFVPSILISVKGAEAV
jgi:hypothetical protein